ncbi:DUF2125 domain-containing protein [Dinoroseobacter sp. PD6]|uniref:DUF2125 domain-containing protein n=1 Tax=Dinoroseobacter sp. PD6 TaxID=3028384 RepID=UPI00237A9A28|nr:DUF2125 domain-containing protein [Dinoroseobacter sp. PD6]MDD9716881.1 DUF2125 domain-containing protein [Dinoroseobacter sp. PD6]
MKWLLGITVTAALAWCAYWYLGASALERNLTAWFEDRRAEGWQAEYSDLSVRGFPNRFDTELTDPAFADPETGLAWQAPFFQLLALSYQPNKVIAVFPNTQEILTPFGRTQLDSTQMRGSLHLGAAAGMPLRSAVFVADAPEFTAGEARLRAQTLRLAMRETEGTDLTYDIGLEALSLAPPVALKRRLDPGDLLPPALETLRLDAVIRFDREWDLRALEDRRPQPTAITLNEARAAWGPLGLRAAGALDIDAQGRGTGEITIKATNWEEILRLAERSGLVPPAVLPLLETGLRALAGLSGPETSIDVPLTFRDGQMRLGFLNLGQGPRFRLR